MEWNIHKIRKTRNTVLPIGRPCIMYDMPSFYGTRNFLNNIPSFALDALSENCTFNNYPCDKDMYDLCRILILENGYTSNRNPYAAVDLYINLRTLIISLLN